MCETERFLSISEKEGRMGGRFFKQNDLIPLLNDNKAYFVEGGKAIRCVEALGTALVQGGMAAADRFIGVV